METYLTLWDAIRNSEAAVSTAIHSCVSDGLSALGDDVHSMEWANASIGAQEEAEAA